MKDISRQVRSGQLTRGQRLAPLRELATRYSISRNTVRAALGQLEEMNLVVRRQGSGTYVSYCPDHQNQQKTVHLFLDSKAHFYSRLNACLVDDLHDIGYHSVNLKYASSVDEALLAETFGWWKERPPRALVIRVDHVDTVRTLQRHLPVETKAIATFSPPEILPPQWSLVTVDSIAKYVLAARHLIRAGHTHLGLVTSEISNRVVSGDRLLVVQQRMQHRRIVRTVNELLREAGTERPLSVHFNEYVEEAGNCDPLSRRNLQRFEDRVKSQDAPTAFFGQDNRMVAVQRVAQGLGLTVGEDISLVGLYNTSWAEAGDLTSVSMREDMVARRIREVITAEEEHLQHTARHIFVQPQLVQRRSVRRPNARQVG